MKFRGGVNDEPRDLLKDIGEIIGLERPEGRSEDRSISAWDTGMSLIMSPVVGPRGEMGKNAV